MLDVKAIAESHGVVYHHHDSFDSPRYHDIDDLENAVHIVYASACGPWQLAINADGSISRPGDKIIAQSNDLLAKVQDLQKQWRAW